MRVIIHPLIFSYHDYSILKVIEHKPYDHNSQARFKIAVAVVNAVAVLPLPSGYSNINLSCKLLCFCCRLSYEYLTPLQAAMGVVQKGLRPTIPKSTNTKLVQILERSWLQDPTLRPDFSEIIEILQQLAKEV
ncbi:ACT protein tyrosine kinase family protein [Trifolium repens]|nr:ACT protein tyrosine kinase family protein [Trifolium repens]